MFLIVRAGVFELEPLGQVVVNLDCAELPAASDGVLDHEVKLGTIESGLAKLLAGVEPFFLTSLDDGLLCKVPVLVRTDVLLFVLGVSQ